MYDGAGRVTDTILQPGGVARWHATQAFHGDHVDVTPPPGGTSTTVYTNARGQVTELRQYHGSTPTGA